MKLIHVLSAAACRSRPSRAPGVSTLSGQLLGPSRPDAGHRMADGIADASVET